MRQAHQREWITRKLFENGKISRNEALKNRITRLAAYINDLKRADFDISAEWDRTGRTKDYVYRLHK
jgi:hypothetical protein